MTYEANSARNNVFFNNYSGMLMFLKGKCYFWQNSNHESLFLFSLFFKINFGYFL